MYHRLRAAFFAGDLVTARKEQDAANRTVDLCYDPRFGGNGLVTLRVVMEAKGVPCGPPRQPHVPLTPAQHEAFLAELKRIDFFSWTQVKA